MENTGEVTAQVDLIKQNPLVDQNIGDSQIYWTVAWVIPQVLLEGHLQVQILVHIMQMFIMEFI